MDAFFTIDFEASCLPRHGRSFPIEVGLADLHGWSRSWLIRPADAWADWTWTEEAQSLHGIDRPTLERKGLPPSQVIAELNTVLSGRRTVAEQPGRSMAEYAFGRDRHHAELRDLPHFGLP